MNADEDFVNTVADLLRGLLSDGIVDVSFTKADGTDRKMRGTTSFDIIAEAMGSDESWRPKNENENDDDPDNDLVRVFDLEKKGWRSFHAASVTSFELSTLTEAFASQLALKPPAKDDPAESPRDYMLFYVLRHKPSENSDALPVVEIKSVRESMLDQLSHLRWTGRVQTDHFMPVMDEV